MLRTGFLVMVVVIMVACKSQQGSEVNKPGIFNGPEIACGNFSVYLLNEKKDGYLQISLDTERYPLKQSNIFDLNEDSTLTIQFKQFDQDISSVVCNDIMSVKPPQPLQLSEARTGKVNLLVSQENLELYRKGTTYKVSIEFKDVKLENNDDPLSFTLQDVIVGWLPG